jgi:hypothetical protein
MATKTNGAAEARWREILERQAGSGRSVRGFCAAEGISEPSFYAWRKRLRMPKEKIAGADRKGERRKKVSDNGQMFIPLQLLGAASTLEIVHPLGYRIQVTGDVNPVALRCVIETLDERAAR